mmetsp:Transcript_67572/g.188558  ORF Transcript_67572/g.188558 Transcript_67572/m.188558 type:complete len:255 (+) Transcript_67572:992-1756(+)
MREVVEGIRQVFFLALRDEPLQAGFLFLRSQKALALVEELRDREAGQLDPLTSRQSERIERPRVVRLLRHAEILEPHDGKHCLPAASDGCRPSGLLRLLVNDVLPLHHTQDADVLIVHVFGLMRLLVARLEVGDDSKLLDDLLQQFHLAGAVDLGLVDVALLHLAGKLEDGHGDLPHRAEHSLQRQHCEFVHDGGQGKAAENHDEYHEDNGCHADDGFSLVRREPVERNHELIMEELPFRHPPGRRIEVERQSL